MARTRSIHPGQALDEDVATMSIWARYVWAFLPCHADREGRLKDSPFTLRAAILPGDAAVDMEAILAELAEREHIIRYQVGGKRYIKIRTFLKYQAPHTREVSSTIPPMSAQPDARHDPGGSSALPGSAGVSPSPSSPDPDPSLSLSSRSSDPDPAGARSNGEANEKPPSGWLGVPTNPTGGPNDPRPALYELPPGPITGYALRKLFGSIRARDVGGYEWQGVASSDGKDTSMAEVLNEDPTARADIAPTMALLFRRAQEGRAGKNSAELIAEPAMAFGAWISGWTSLREELHGMTPSAPVAKPPRRASPPLPKLVGEPRPHFTPSPAATGDKAHGSVAR